jgi:hypothetical protein
MRQALTSITHSVLDDHRRMRSAITALEALVRSGESVTSQRGVVLARVEDLRQQLERHFSAEEAGGLFEQIEQSAPDTSDACGRLRRQHATILTALRRSRDELPLASARHAKLSSWAASVRDVLAELKAHEEREDQLLLAALEGGRGAPD